MFFIDSMTTPKSVGLTMAREMGLRATARTAPFLDNSEDVSAIKATVGKSDETGGEKGERCRDLSSAPGYDPGTDGRVANYEEAGNTLRLCLDVGEVNVSPDSLPYVMHHFH